jgi:hypothetical protein
MGALCPPCLLPLPWLHGCSALLLSLLQELISCGVQRIAVVVPAAPSIQDTLSSPPPTNNQSPFTNPNTHPVTTQLSANFNVTREPSMQIRQSRPSFDTQGPYQGAQGPAGGAGSTLPALTGAAGGGAGER